MYILNNIYDVRKANIKIQKKNGFSDIDTVEHSLSVSVQVLKLHHTQSSLAQELMNKHTNFYGDDLGITLIDVLTNEQSFEIFVKHLSLEFSLECLLSLIEFIQFQQMIDEYINNAQLRIPGEPTTHKPPRKDSKGSNLSHTSNTSTHSSHTFSMPTSNGNINGDKVTGSAPTHGSIIANFTNQIFSSNKPSQLGCNKPTITNNIDMFDPQNQSLQNNAPEIIDDEEFEEMQKRRFLYKRIQFPCNVPKSKIVYDGIEYLINNNNDDSKSNNDAQLMQEIDHEEFVRQCKLKAFTLYRRYVVGGSGLEINVGWSIKKKLLNVMGNNNKIVLDISLVEQWEISLFGLIKLFDQCCNQMLVLMKDSFDRFKQTKQFDKLKKGLFSNQQRATETM